MVRLFKWFGNDDQAPIPFVKAQSVLSKEKTVSATQAGQIFRLSSEAMVPYSVKTLNAVKRENRKLGRRWYLVATFGLSFKTLSLKRAIEPTTSLARATIDNTSDEMGSSLVCRYVLVDLKPRCEHWSWNWQERYLKTRPHLSRIRAGNLAEILHVLYRIHGKQFLTEVDHLGELKLFEGLYNSPSTPGSGHPIRIGHSREGVSLLSCLSLGRHQEVPGCMIVMRKPDVNI